MKTLAPLFLTVTLTLSLAGARGPLRGDDEAKKAEEKKIPPAAEVEVDFARDIQPILEKNCLRCHGPEKQKSKYRLDSREAAIQGGENGHAIVVGKSAESPLIRFVAHVDPDIKMPSNSDPLTAREIGVLRAWIDQGVKWAEKAAPAKSATVDLKTLKGQKSWVTSLALASDGVTLATGGGHTLVIKPGEVKLWDAVTGEARAALEGHEKTVWSVAFDREGKTLATASYDRTVKLWDVASRKERATLKGHSSWVTCVAFSPSGQTLATGSEDTTIKVWEVASLKELATLKGHTATVRSLAFSPDGKTLVSGSFDHTAKLWDAEKFTELGVLKGHTDAVWSLVFDREGKTLASGSADGTVKLWARENDAEKGLFTERATLTGHQNWVSCVVFSPDGKKLASGGFDGSVKVWSVARQSEIATLGDLKTTVWSVAFSADGKSLVLASGAAEGTEDTVKFWNVPREKKEL